MGVLVIHRGITVMLEDSQLEREARNAPDRDKAIDAQFCNNKSTTEQPTKDSQSVLVEETGHRDPGLNEMRREQEI